ncbi:FG-GAP repeat protein [Coraliomargarita sp. W4R72]
MKKRSMFRIKQFLGSLLWICATCAANASVIVTIGDNDFNPVDLSIVGERELAEGSMLDLQIHADFDASKILSWIIIGEPDPIGEIEWSFEILESPAGMTIAADGQLNWIGKVNSGPHISSQRMEVRAIASEKDGDRTWSDTIDAYLFVLPLAPRVSEFPLPLYYAAGIQGTERIHIYDADDTADGEQLQFSILSGPRGCHITDRGELYWIPPLHAQGQEFELILQVADGNEHGQGPSQIEITLHVTDAPAGAKSQDTVYKNVPGFGSAICRDQARLVVGADQYSQVFIYKDAAQSDSETNDSVDWQLETTLTGLPLTVEEGSEFILKEITPGAFGASVAINANWLLVGAPLTDLKSVPYGDNSRTPIIAAGAAFFYHHDTDGRWRLRQVVYDNHNSYSDPYQFFGGSVAMQDGVAIISNDSANDKAGEAAIYTYNSDYDRWERHDTIDPYDIPLQTGDHFSYPLVIDGNTIAIAANEDDSAGLNAGAVYLFDWPTSYPVTQTKITPHTPQTFGLFGQAIALSGDWLAIAAPNARQLAGEVELWQRQSTGQWEFQQSLSELGTYYYGQQLSLEAGTLAVSSPGFQHNETEYAGRIYLYRYDGNAWIRILQHQQEDYQATTNFGHRMTLSPDGQSLSVTSLGSKLSYDYSLAEGDFPAESHPVNLLATNPSLNNSDFLKLYQNDSLSTDSQTLTSQVILATDQKSLTYTYPERTDATGFEIEFLYSRNLKDWHPLESFIRLHSTRMQSGWLQRISIELPLDSQPFFIRQSIDR